MRASPAAAVRSDSEVAKSVAESLRLRPVGTINVLVVEDDEMQRLVLDKLFTAANGKNDGIVTFDVTFAATAAEAVATLEAPKCVQFSIILLDMMLPDLNGYDLNRLMRMAWRRRIVDSCQMFPKNL